ncbi:hypothetical protein ACRQ84_06200 [Enterobacter ludwigii]
MKERKLTLLEQVMSAETIEELSKRLKVSEEVIEKLQQLAKRYRIK